MSVYVDELHKWPAKHAPRCFKDGSCHLTADTTEELHAFAYRLGMRRSWYQPKSSPHYDLTRSMRRKALLMGAEFVAGKEQARKRIEARKAR